MIGITRGKRRMGECQLGVCAWEGAGKGNKAKKGIRERSRQIL